MPGVPGQQIKKTGSSLTMIKPMTHVSLNHENGPVSGVPASQSAICDPSRTLLTEKHRPKLCPGTPEKRSHMFTESVPKKERQEFGVFLLLCSYYYRTRTREQNRIIGLVR
jgi:hypothetical protein